MTKKNYLLILLLPLLFIACSKDDSPIVVQDQTMVKLQQTTDDIYNKYIAQYPDFPGSLVLKVDCKKGSYFIVAGDKSITSSTHFRCASNTKSFTAASVVYLAQQGKLDINAKITDTIPGTNMTYIPRNPEFDIPYVTEITIRQLLQHKAGVFDVSNEVIPDTVSATVPYKGDNFIQFVQASDPSHTFTFDEMVSVVSICRLFYFAPGTSYHYSNTGYSILGKIIERVSGKSYHDFVTENIINRMGLTNTTCPVLGTESTIPSPFATGYVSLPDSSYNVTVSNISANVAEGNIITTADDLSKYLRTLLRGEGPLDIWHVNNMFLSPIDGSLVHWYACGIENLPNLGFGHSGAHEGYLSRMAYDPQTDFSVVVYTNAWNYKDGLPSLYYQFMGVLDDLAYKSKMIVLE